MRVLIAMDKFKGSLTALQAGEAVRAGLRQVWPDVQAEVCPIADGGEGTMEALAAALGAERRTASVQDAQGRVIEAAFALAPDGTAVMEMSAASGLVLVRDLPLDPWTASTYGTGELMLAAMKAGARKLIIGIGGSATNDGGSGMAQALGFAFLDEHGAAVESMPRDWQRVVRVQASALPMPEIVTACDVNNPLLGEHGATRVYGAQKGVTDMAAMEARMAWLADLVKRDLGRDAREEPGAGAAGGLGWALMTFCGARLESGFDLIAEAAQLEQRIAQADLVITGEGRVDAQTLHGKGPAGVAAMARKHGKRVVAVAGIVQEAEAVGRLFDAALSAKPEAMPVEQAMREGARLVEETVVRHAAQLRELVL